MKIEDIKLIFHPACPFERLPLSDIQKQYLSDLRMNISIKNLVHRYLKMGWLVNFDELYGLIELLACKQWILNVEVIEFFKNVTLKNLSQFHLRPAVANTSASSQYSLEQLKTLPFFRSLNPSFTDFLIRSASVYEYLPEMVVCQSGEKTRDLYVLLSGQAAIYRTTKLGRQFVAVLAQSSVFGENGFFLGGARTADIIVQKKSDILVIPYNEEVLGRYLNQEKAKQVVQHFWVQHALSQSDFFQNFPPDSLDQLMFSGKIQEIVKGQVLFKEGEMAQDAFLLIQGILAVEKSQVKINTLAQGAFFGEIALLLTAGQRSATVVAERDSVVMSIDRNDFFKVLAENLFLAKEIQKLAEKRIDTDKMRYGQKKVV